MKTVLDCYPCFVRQAIESVRLTGASEETSKRLVDEVLSEMGRINLDSSPPEFGGWIYRRVREISGVDDPYAGQKKQHNALALELLPELRERIHDSSHPFETAGRLAVAGNIIDLGVDGNLQETRIRQIIDAALTEPLDGEFQELQQAAADARSILFLADNAGEIVIDRLLLEFLPLDRVTVSVRGRPILNDATRQDAERAGLTDLVPVIDNGSDFPGTVLEHCSEAFRKAFHEADLVISKGQGNFETLDTVDHDIFFILRAKCPVVARMLGCPLGSAVVRRSHYGRQKAEGTPKD